MHKISRRSMSARVDARWLVFIFVCVMLLVLFPIHGLPGLNLAIENHHAVPVDVYDVGTFTTTKRIGRVGAHDRAEFYVLRPRRSTLMLEIRDTGGKLLDEIREPMSHVERGWKGPRLHISVGRATPRKSVPRG